MQAKLSELDRIASDLANISTAGYKTERTAAFAAERDFASELLSAVDVAAGGTRTDLGAGTITNTGRNLDVAIDGDGFFAIETAHGTRYTRSGNFTRRADGTLTTLHDEPVLDVRGRRLKLGPGALEFDTAGAIHIDGTEAGRVQIWHIDEKDLIRETGSRFRAAPGVAPKPSTATLVPQALEQANVSAAERMVTLTELTRNFEALQRGISVLMNDIDSRTIVELGRR
jgi:flagellar basal-body rod protein FlgF/flagellar basal-body rod protein FlgG